MEIIPIDHQRAMERALDCFSRQKIVVFPTDTVYGMGTMAFSKSGIDRLYAMKGRAHTKAIAILIGSLDQLPGLLNGFPESAEILARMFWPGALTLIVKKNPSLPENISPLPTIGIRMPDHEFARNLLKASGPLATTSANLSGEPDARSVLDVLNQFDSLPDLILDGGPSIGGVPSTVVDCTCSPVKIIRQGSISEDDILAAIG